MKTYIARREFQKHNGKTYPVGTEFTCRYDPVEHEGGETEWIQRIYHPDDGFMCNCHSEKSHKCLVGNDDGKGVERGELIGEIEDLVLCENLDIRYKRIRLLWSDLTAALYSDGGDPDNDPWYWNDEFYCATIYDLKYLRNRLAAVGGEEGDI